MYQRCGMIAQRMFIASSGGPNRRGMSAGSGEKGDCPASRVAR
jgi:hypothetical protein